MGRVNGKVALITGAARGQGRAHAIRLAEEGADILALDICGPVPRVEFPPATEDDLAETVEAVERLGRRIIAQKGDVRNQHDIDKLVADGLQEMGHIDVLIANAGIAIMRPTWEYTDEEWSAQIDTDLTGVWRCAKAVVPPMIAAGNGGSLIFVSSGVVSRGLENAAAYSSAKHGLVGLSWTLAIELGRHRIRVNTLQPGNTRTKILDNEVLWKAFTPGQDDVPLEQRRGAVVEMLTRQNLLPTPWNEPQDVAEAALFLASDEAYRITGSRLVIDGGYSIASGF